MAISRDVMMCMRCRCSRSNSAADFIDTVINVNYWCLLSYYPLHDMATKVYMFMSNDDDVMLKDVRDYIGLPNSP